MVKSRNHTKHNLIKTNLKKAGFRDCFHDFDEHPGTQQVLWPPGLGFLLLMVRRILVATFFWNTEEMKIILMIEECWVLCTYLRSETLVNNYISFYNSLCTGQSCTYEPFRDSSYWIDNLVQSNLALRNC